MKPIVLIFLSVIWPIFAISVFAPAGDQSLLPTFKTIILFTFALSTAYYLSVSLQRPYSAIPTKQKLFIFIKSILVGCAAAVVSAIVGFIALLAMPGGGF